MKLSNGSRILTIAVMVSLLVLIAVCCLAGVVLRYLSISFAHDNPGLQYMRLPVFFLSISVIGIFALNLLFAEILLVRILSHRIFSESSVRMLKLMSWLFMAGLALLVTLGIYTELNVHYSITQIYVTLFAVIYLAAGLVFRLLANLIHDASLYKQEVDMTV